MNTKQHTLALLEKNRGKSISGAWIGSQLDVSRNAVWKAINELRDEGYRIDAITNRGYRFYEGNDILSREGIAPFLQREGDAEKLHVYSALDSTNKTAKGMAVTGAEHGTVIVADSQTSGRGRYDRQFFSPPGGLYMSFILHPRELSLKTPTLITMIAAVKVCEAIEAVADKSPLIKWVNDIFLDRKKICGILTEAVADFESGGVQWIVLGIGVNFSADKNSFPDDLRQVAGAVFPSGSHSVTRNQLAAEIINRILHHSERDYEEALGGYKRRMMMLGKKISVVGPEGTYRATAVDIDDTGRLIVQTEGGETRVLSSGEISIRK